MNFSQEQISIFNNMILEAIIYGRSCEDNIEGYADDKDLCASVKLFLNCIDVKNVNYKREGYINLANDGSLTHIES